MKKKTIGALLAALRKAKGLTQRELAEELNVSDKAVSRWERDECAPDITLLPIIADFFGITVDELVRGERMREDATAEQQSHAAESAAKRMRALMQRQLVRVRNLNLWVVLVAGVGFLVAVLLNFAFLRGLAGFFVGAMFSLGALIFEIVILTGAFLPPDGEDEEAHNQQVAKAGGRVLILIGTLFAATIPLLFLRAEAHGGLTAASFWPYALLFAAVALLILSVCHMLFFRRFLAARGVAFGEDSERERAERRLLRRCAAVCLALLIPTLAASAFIRFSLPASTFAKPEVFRDYDSFVAFMEKKTDMWGNIDIVINGEVIGSAWDDKSEYPYNQILAEDGTVLCEYHWYNQQVTMISARKLPIRVYTYSALYHGIAVKNDTADALIIVAGVEIFATVLYFCIKRNRLQAHM